MLPLPQVKPLDARQKPALEHYLEGLADGSRRAITSALNVIARLASGDTFDARSFPWGSLGGAETAAIRQALEARYAPATSNKMLAALRGVLKAARKLKQLDTIAYHQANSGIRLVPTDRESRPR